MENSGSQSLDDSFTSSMDETLSSGDGTPVSMDRQSSVPTNRTYTISKHSSWVESEDSELSTPRSDYSSSYQSSVATNRTYTVAKADHRAESGFEHGPLPRVPTEESLGDDDSRQDDETPTYRDTPRPPTETPEWRHKLGSTPPLMRAKAPSTNSREIIQELRKDGFIGRSTPLIPRIMRQTKSSIAFEYFFRPKGVAPRLLPRLKSDGNVGQTRAEVPRRDSPLKKSVKLYRWKSPVKSFNRWPVNGRLGSERRRVLRAIPENPEKRHKLTEEKDDWKIVGEYWQELRERKERERLHDEERRNRERKILNELMGRRSKDQLH